MRTWTLPEFWELTSWPFDSDRANVRFGFPVTDELDSDAKYESDDNNVNDVEEVDSTGSQSFIADITSIQDLAREVIDQDKEKKIWTRYTAWKRLENSMPNET